MLLQGKIAGIKEGKLWVCLPVTPTEMDKIQSICKKDVVVEVEDGRQITLAQRRKCYVLIKCISDWWGYTSSEVMKELLKHDFFGQGETIGLTHKEGLFSLPDILMNILCQLPQRFTTWNVMNKAKLYQPCDK